MRLGSICLSITRIGQTASAFSPVSLFAAGEVGAWFDPSDLSTMFQDAAGTIPVTSVGQPVGKILDKSGCGNHATQTSAAARPVLQQDSLGIYRLYCDGTKTLATANINLSAYDKLSVWVGSSISAVTGNKGLFTAGASAVNPSAYNYIIANRLTSKLVGSTATSEYASSLKLRANRANINYFLYDFGGSSPSECIKIKHNGTNAIKTSGPTNVAGSSNFGTNKITLGSGIGLNQVGAIYETIFRFSKATPTQEEVTSANKYLATKLGRKMLCVIGDSIVADYLTYYETASNIEAFSPATLAVPNHNIAQQKAVWQAVPDSDKSAFSAVIIQVGINNLNPAATVAEIISGLQDLVSTVKATNEVWLSQITPARQRFITIYGATDGAVVYQKWLDVNAAIEGGGSTPITGADRIITSHVALMNDGSGNLAAAYDTGDGIHPNEGGRAVNANAWLP